MKKFIEIEGMSCGHCLMAVEKALSKLEPDSLKVQIGIAEFSPGKIEITDDKIIAALINAGYKVKKIRTK